MQRDKAALVYHDQPQLDRSFELVQHFCAAAWVSVRADQTHEPGRARFPLIIDRQGVAGPIAGISAAQHAHPGAAWLVLACDLPFVTAALLEILIRSRSPTHAATAFRSAHDGLPEPLCAVWEPASAVAVDGWIAQGRHCPRHLLGSIDANLLDLPQGRALDNINTPAERDMALRELSKHAHPNDA